VRIADAGMREGERRGESNEKSEQRFHGDLCGEAR
jgi:hypothetical protein